MELFTKGEIELLIEDANLSYEEVQDLINERIKDTHDTGFDLGYVTAMNDYEIQHETNT